MPKKPAQKPKPRNLRFNLKSHLLYLCSCCAIFTLLLLTSLNLETYFRKSKVLAAQAQSGPLTELVHERAFWEEKVALYPTYLDGWLSLARINFKLEDWQESQRALEMAKKIDPNSIKIINLEKELF